MVAERVAYRRLDSHRLAGKCVGGAHVARDYYLILGVDPDATQDQIRSAYRQKAKKLHPDCSGGSCEPFQAVLEAYEVLSDPTRRREYDDRLAQIKRVSRTARKVSPEPLRSRRVPIEPLIPTDHDSVSREGWKNESRYAWFDDLWRHWRGMDEPIGPSRGTPEAIHVEVALTWQQALYGGRTQILISVQTYCPACQGHGRTRFYPCQECSGHGVIIGEYLLSFSFPSGIRDGAKARVQLEQLGMGNTTMVIHFRVHG
jgi:curved DNA-binding protein CbpA